MTKESKTISPEHEYLGAGKSAAYGLQHVFTMYGGIIAPPLIVGTAAGLSAQHMVQGVSFAGVAMMIAIVTTGGG